MHSNKDRLIIIGENIEFERTDRNLTKTQLADMCDFNIKTIIDLEYGRRNATVRTLARVSEALGCSMADFFEGL